VRLAAPQLWDGVIPAQPLGLDPQGALAVPSTAGGLGWWADGPRPGETGAAVVVGHVDLDGRRGVFARLAGATPGTLVEVQSGSRGPVRYRVTRVDRYAKTSFPSSVVYRPSAEAELRLVTCGGRFDPRTGHYEDNVVVQAVRERPA
jgi:sortase (surface protein transpeptidase)